MSLIRRALMSAQEIRGANPFLEWGSTSPPPPSGMSSGHSVSTQSAVQIAAVYGSVGLLADSVSSLPLRALDRPTPKVATAKEVKLPLLLEEPFSEISLTDFLVMFVWSLALRGNFFGKIIKRDRMGYVEQIMPVNPDVVQITRSKQNGALEYKFGGELQRLENVFHVKYQSMPGSIVGLNPIQVMRHPLGIAHAQDLMAESYFRNSAVPSVVISTEDDLTPEEADRLKNNWASKFQGTYNGNLPAVVSGGMTVSPLTITPEDSQFLESRKFSTETISGLIFRVPPFMLGMVERSTCLTGETPVFTEHGPKEIKNVRAGERVWSLDEGQSRFRLARVEAQSVTGVDPILNIRTKSGRTVRANAKHKILVRRRFPDPQPGVGRSKCVRWDNVWVRADELDVGDMMVAAHGLPGGEMRVAPNGRNLTTGFMEFCGLLVGDGNVLRNSGTVTIARHREARYMDVYRRDAQREFRKSTEGGTFTAAKRATAPIRLREYERCTTFSSVRAATELTELGFSGTAHTKRVPGWVFELAPDLQLAFLRGYADADGHVSKTGELIYSSANRDLLQDVRHLLFMVGVPVGGIGESNTEGECVVAGRTVKRGRMYRLNCSDADENLRIGSHDPKDMQRLRSAPRSTRRQWHHADFQGRGPSPAARPGTEFAIEGGRLQRIVSIDVTAPEPVYDLTVEGTHTFLADGVVVHNSFGRGIEQQERTFVTNTLQGYLTRIERSLGALLPPKVFPNFDLSQRLRGDTLQRAQAGALAMQAGFAVANDIRAWFDWPDLPGGEGDKPFVPINTTLLEKLTDEVEDGSDDDPEAQQFPQQGFPPAKK